ncbi:MAG: flagellar motor stator protein MotA [Candidatus Eisenbacteria bacterium]|uniref:Flagellar motor stator protein MotA n=1 Tax=Eiseniibacteriota bacterium TaxID=2212470 RepID=A0A956N8G1_UNCEI|nr:flagellar motor stator protein MotA [Candidatus Eisenbacteria bacterium]MCB9463026.1 flagellar motor stator protein MotA [Candidatus Eisenbacteria bacterium]
MRFVGFIVVLGCVVAGFVLSGGQVATLIQPFEVLVIFGAATGATLIMALPQQFKKLFPKAMAPLKGSAYSKPYAQEALVCLFQLALLVKKEGVIALEGHINEPSSSDIFSKYPKLMKDHHLLHFITDALRLQVDGAVTPEELSDMLDRELEAHHQEEHVYPHLVHLVADSLPGLGIVAAVLGIIITMGHLNGSPEEIGHHVAVALVGTFLGILVSYGFAGPVSTAMEQELADGGNFFGAVKHGLVAFAEGKAPVVVVETARRALYSYNRPDRETVEEACKELRAA